MQRISQTVCPQYLVDEPHATEYTSLARTAAKIRAQDSRALSFINLDGSNVSGVGAFNQTGWAREWSGRIDASASDLAGYTYQTYVQEFVDVVRPDVICYDHYPTFGRLGLGAGQQADARAQDTREDYVKNLRIVGEISRNASIPMWLYFNIVPCKFARCDFARYGSS